MTRLSPAGPRRGTAGPASTSRPTKSSAAASGGPAGVGEPDQIRQHVIAERARDRRAAGARRRYGRVEPLGLLDVAVAVAREA